MGLGDEYSRDALFRRPGQEYDSDPDREESPDDAEPMHPEDWEALYADEIYADVVRIQVFVYDNHALVLNRYGVAEYCDLLQDQSKWWSDVNLKMPIMALWRSLNLREETDPQAFQNWLEHYIQLY